MIRAGIAYINMSRKLKIFLILILQFFYVNNLLAQTTGFANITVSGSTSKGSWSTSGNTFYPSANGATVSVSEIQTRMANGDVIISTACSSCSENGDITISSSILSKISNTNANIVVLKFLAERNIFINNQIDLGLKDGISEKTARDANSLEFISQNGNIISSSNGLLKTDPLNDGKAYKGGSINLLALNGSVQINGAITTKSSTSGGPITIIGNKGVTIAANITSSGGTSGILKITDNNSLFSSGTDYSNQGQTSGVFTIASFENAGTGVFKIKGVNVYSGNTTLSAGSLYLGAHNSVPITSNIIFNGGDFRPNGFDTKVNSIKVSANSTLTFDPLQSSIFTITDIDTTGPTVNTYLIIREWQGFSQSTALTKFGSLENASSDFVNTNGKLQSAPTPGGLNQYGQILTSMGSGASGGLKGIFQGTNNRLSDNFLRRIRFYNGTSYYSSTQISSKEIVPNAVIP